MNWKLNWAKQANNYLFFLPLLSLTSSTYTLLVHLNTLNNTHKLGRTPLDEGSARLKDLYLTALNTHKRHISMPSAGFEPVVPASERPQTYALDRAAIGIGDQELSRLKRLVLPNSIKHTETVQCLPSRSRKTRKKVFLRGSFWNEASFILFALTTILKHVTILWNIKSRNQVA
jgi:hypothetical protein